jgi:hypothetical protein
MDLEQLEVMSAVLVNKVSQTDTAWKVATTCLMPSIISARAFLMSAA